jgi:hypothetical protein
LYQYDSNRQAASAIIADGKKGCSVRLIADAGQPFELE